MDALKKYFSVPDIAIRWGKCSKTVIRAIEAGQLHAHKLFGDKFSVSVEDLIDYEEKHRYAPKK